MVTTRLSPLPSSVFDVPYQDVVDRVERRVRSKVTKALRASYSDLVNNTALGDIVDDLNSGRLTPVNLYLKMSELLVDVDMTTEPIQEMLDKMGLSVMRVSSREVAKRVDAYLRGKPDEDFTRRDVAFDSQDPFLISELLRSGRVFWNTYERDTLRAIREEIENAYVDGDPADVVASRISLVAGLSPRQAQALRNMRATMARGPLSPVERAKQIKAYADRLRDDRAKMVARTELVRASNAALAAYWAQMMANGSLDRNQVVLRWNTHFDERYCSVCKNLDGKTTAINGQFSSGIYLPPAHPNCRCYISMDTLTYSAPTVEYVAFEKAVRRPKVSSPLRSLEAGGERIAAAMTPEERSERTRRGWLKRQRAKVDIKSDLRVSVRTQTEAARRKSGVDMKPSASLDDWTPAEQASMLDYLKKTTPGFSGIKRIADAVEILVENLEHLIEQMGGIDSPRAKRSRHWYTVANKIATKLGGGVSEKAPDAVGAAVLAVFSPKTDWAINVGQGGLVTRMWSERYIPDESVLEGAYDRLLKSQQNAIQTITNRLAKQREELKQMTSTGLTSKGKPVNKKQLDDKRKAIKKSENALVDANRLMSETELVGKDMFVARYSGQDFRKIATVSPDIAAFVFMARIDTEEHYGVDVVPNEDGTYSYTQSKKTLTAPSQANALKAIRILRASSLYDSGEITTEEMRQVISIELGSGTKVRSFYTNIYDPDDIKQLAATMDTHAGSANLLLPLGNNALPIEGGLFTSVASLGVGSAYMIHAEAIRRVATKYGLLPREIQSIAWDWQLNRYGYPQASAKTIVAREQLERMIKIVERMGWDELRRFDGLIAPLYSERKRLRAIKKSARTQEEKDLLASVEQQILDISSEYDKLLNRRKTRPDESKFIKDAVKAAKEEEVTEEE